MNNVKEAFVQFPFLRAAKSEERVEIHLKKIIPKKEDINFRREHQENEWQQEYFIIYNSYVLDEKDAE